MNRKPFRSLALALSLALVLQQPACSSPMSGSDGPDTPAPPPTPSATPPSDHVYRIGPGQRFASLSELTSTQGDVFDRDSLAHLLPGDTVEIYPNIQVVDGIEANMPYDAQTNDAKGLMVYVSGTSEAPITIRGVIDDQGRRPILERSSGFKNVVTVFGDHIVMENLIVDGGMRVFLDWLNGEASADNRFGYNSRAHFAGQTVTIETLHTYLRLEAGGTLFAGRLEDYLVESDAAQLFARRGIFHEGGDNLTVRNCMAIGCGTGLTSADVGPGSILVEQCEFAYNGMNAAGHNVYLNGDNAIYQGLTVVLRNNLIHHSLYTMGMRSRVGRTIVQGNLFWDNGLRHLDLICTQKDEGDFAERWAMYVEVHGAEPPDDWWWATRFGYREDHEVIGNLFVNTATHNFGGIRLGGAMPEGPPDHLMEASLGRYRIVNNTFVHLASTSVERAAIEAQFGVESIEMYNNVFYSNSPEHTAPFWDQLSDQRINGYVAEAQAEYAQAAAAGRAVNRGWLNDDGSRFNAGYGEENANQWRYGLRQVAGASNWVSYGSLDNRISAGDDNQYYDGVPDEWEGTMFGRPGEDPFQDLAGFDFRLKETSSACQPGVPVGSTADFLSEDAYDALLESGALPLWESYHYDYSSGEIAIDSGDKLSPAPWQDLCFQGPTARLALSPPLAPTIGTPGSTWDWLDRAESDAPRIGAY